jgi:hypothetical protein
MSEGPPAFSSTRYFVAHQGQNRGPFDRQLIEVFLLSGYFPADIEVREEGTDSWAKWSSVMNPPPIPTQTRVRAGSKRSARSFPKGKALVLIAIVITVLLIWLIPREETTTTVTPSSAETPAVTKLPEQNTPPDTSQSQSAATPSFDSSVSLSSDSLGSSPAESQSDTTASATAPTQTYQDENGRMYLLSDPDYRRLSKKREALVSEQESLNKGYDELETKQADLKKAEANLDKTSQRAVNAYNRKIDAYNALRARLKKKVETFERDKEAFNTELARVGTPQ